MAMVVEASWSTHIIEIEGSPAEIFVNTAFMGRTPVAGLPELVMCHIPVAATRENDLPSDEAFQTIYAFEDRIMELFPDGGEDMYVGRYADGTQAIFHIYTKRATHVVDMLEADKALLDIVGFGCRVQADPGWEVYLDVLSPDQEALNRNSNESVRFAMAQQGDDGTKSREVNHYAYFNDRAARKAFTTFLRSENFAILKAPFLSRDGQFSLIFSQAIRPVDIDKTTLILSNKASELNGLYDGWECALVGAQQ